MKLFHTPQVNARYWTAITLASVFGTNLGDLYAHESGLGIVKGLLVLAVLVAVVFLVERREDHPHEAYYWLVIILIRTGATNIADYLAFRVRIPELPLTLGLLTLIALFGWGTRAGRQTLLGAPTLPKTNAAYWLAMLGAGVFGTVLGDICQHGFGQGTAAMALTFVLLVTLFAGFRYAAKVTAVYWTLVTVARTTGTALGDFLAENDVLKLGLPIATLISGLAFVGVLVLWRSSKASQLQTSEV